MFKKLMVVALAVGAVGAAALPGDEEKRKQFCDGYEAGYKSIAGEGGYVPQCPAHQLSYSSRTPVDDGVKQGIKDAKADPARRK
jgi:hypothetical protein